MSVFAKAQVKGKDDTSHRRERQKRRKVNSRQRWKFKSESRSSSTLGALPLMRWRRPSRFLPVVTGYRKIAGERRTHRSEKGNIPKRESPTKGIPQRRDLRMLNEPRRLSVAELAITFYITSDITCVL
jgi:hypothetical protein